MIFLDASAAAKRYWQEPGSDRIKDLFYGPVPLCSIVLLGCELASALNRRHREGDLTGAERYAARGLVAQDLHRLRLVPVNDELIEASIRLLDAYPLKTLDSLYLAGALNMERAWGSRVLFVSVDRQLLRAAEAEGLNVLDPESA